MVKRFCCLGLVLLLICSFSAPVFAVSTAHPNSVGQNSISPSLVGISISDSSGSGSGVWPMFFSEDSVSIEKLYSSYGPFSLSSYPYVFFVFSVPSSYYSYCDLAFDLAVATSAAPTVSSAYLFTGSGSGSNYISLSGGWNVTLDLVNYRSSNELTLISCSRSGITLGEADYLVLQVHMSGCNLVSNVTFSQSVSSSLSGSLNMSSVKSSGSVNLGNVATTYYGTNVSSYPSSYGFLRVVQASDGKYYIGFNDADNLKYALPNITSSSSFSGSAPISLNMSSSGGLSSSSVTTTMVRADAQLIYGDDGGLVDEVFNQGVTLDSMETELIDQGKTLDGIKTEQVDQGKTLDRMETEQTDQGKTLDDIAANMQTVVDDLQAQYDTAEDIGGATSESTINSTQATLSSGTASLNSGLEVAGDVASVSSPAGMYIGLMTATVTPMLNFGNGVLYWALFAILIGSVILFILRRVGK